MFKVLRRAYYGGALVDCPARWCLGPILWALIIVIRKIINIILLRLCRKHPDRIHRRTMVVRYIDVILHSSIMSMGRYLTVLHLWDPVFCIEILLGLTLMPSCIIWLSRCSWILPIEDLIKSMISYKTKASKADFIIQQGVALNSSCYWVYSLK